MAAVLQEAQERSIRSLPNNKNPPADKAGGFLLLISISLCQHLFSKTRTGTFPDMGAVFRLKRSGAQTAPNLFLLGFSYKENTRHKCGPEGSKREKPHGARLAHRRVGNREHFRCRRCKLTPQKVGSDSELSRGRLQPSRRAECDLLRKRRGERRVCALIFTKNQSKRYKACSDVAGLAGFGPAG